MTTSTKANAKAANVSKLPVKAKLNRLGRALVARPNGARVTFNAEVRGTVETFAASGSTRVVP